LCSIPGYDDTCFNSADSIQTSNRIIPEGELLFSFSSTQSLCLSVTLLVFPRASSSQPVNIFSARLALLWDANTHLMHRSESISTLLGEDIGSSQRKRTCSTRTRQENFYKLNPSISVQIHYISTLRKNETWSVTEIQIRGI